MGYFPRVLLDPQRSDDMLPRFPGRFEYHAGTIVPTGPSFHSTEVSLLEYGPAISGRQAGPLWSIRFF